MTDDLKFFKEQHNNLGKRLCPESSLDSDDYEWVTLGHLKKNFKRAKHAADKAA